MSRWWLPLAVASLLWPAAPPTAEKEQAVGLVMTPGGGKLLRAGRELPLAAKAGEILFAGDSLRSEAEPASFLFCPEKSLHTLAPKGEVILASGQVKVRSGALASKTPVPSCFLPQVVRVAVASQQHYGVTMTRTLRPAAPPEGTLASRLQALAADQRKAAEQELAPLQSALAANADDPAARVSRATILEKYKLNVDALEDYRKAAQGWPDAVWVRGKIFELQESIDLAAAATAPAGAGGKTLALLVGVSKYQRLPESQWLQYAHADAAAFEKHVKSPRGGGLPDENVLLLANEKATTAAVRNAFGTLFKGRAGKKDTVLLFLAAHGIVETEGTRNAYIVTYDADPQDLAATALPMADIQKLVRDELTHVGRVLVFVDVCRSGNIGSIKSTVVNASVERLAEAEGEIFGLMASRPKELSYEGPEFGGGHGAFSYFLLKALTGAADKNKDNIVDANEVIGYVQERVAEMTRDKQHPRDFGSIGNQEVMADITKPGIELTSWPAADFQDHRLYLAALGEPPPIPAAALRAWQAASPPDAIQRFRAALDARRLLPDAPGSAFAALDELKRQLTPEQYILEENRLRVALEDAGQQVLLRYLAGDQTPQTQADFAGGAAYFEAAKTLTPESQLLEARHAFCRGRALLFGKDYRQAADLLEQSARVDPGGAYSYNALGIAYLEQADYSRAILSFREAVRLAPYWAYPLHNLALAHTEMGDYREAVRRYQQAVRLAPQYAYLPYNLGLLYQRLNQKRDAQAAYSRAIELAPDSGEPYNALGALRAAAGRDTEAERLYRQALDKNANLLAARHNLALLLARKPDRVREAVQLWELNLSKAPDDLPSRLSLAETLAQQGQHGDAAQQYLAITARKPDYLAARLAAADQLAKANRSDEALDQLRTALDIQPKNATAYEQMGDLESARGRRQQAMAAYQAALERAADPRARKQIRAKMKRLG